MHNSSTDFDRRLDLRQASPSPEEASFERPTLAMRIAAFVVVATFVTAGAVAAVVGLVLAAALAVVASIAVGVARLGNRRR